MIKRLKFLFIAFMTFWLLVTICHFLLKPTLTADVEKLENDWAIEYNDEIYDNISIYDIPEKVHYNAKEGDVISLTTIIPPSNLYDFPTLMFLSRYAAYDIFIDGEPYLSKYKDLMESDEFIGCYYSVISVPKKSGPLTVKITFYVEEDTSNNFFVPPTYGAYHDVIRSFIFTHMFPLASGIFLIIFGAAFFIITLGFYRTLPNILSQLFSSIVFINLGIWLLCYFELLDFYVYTKSQSTEVEYLCLYVMVPLTYLIIGCIQQHYKDWIFLVIAVTSSLICLLLIALHFTNIMHMNRTLPYFQCVSITCSVFMLTIFARDLKQKTLAPAEVIQLTGLAIFAFSYLVNFVTFYLESHQLIPEASLSTKLIPMAGLIFVFANLINYFIYLSESFAMRKEYASLTHLAYADGLTDLPNRSRYDKYMSDLDKGNEEYCIISLDLNGLKEINDNDGHATGDKYLLEFSTVLKQCFEDKAFIARIGGDEFVAIMKKSHFEEIDSLLTRLRDALEVKNILYPGYRRSVASGYAFSTEVEERNSHSVYLLADKRMYENKKLMHAKLGITARI